MSDLVELVRSIIEGLERGNPQPLLQTLSDRVEWNEAENGPYWEGAAWVGGEAIMANVFARIQQDFQDLRLTVRRVVGCGNTVLVEGRYRQGQRPARGYRRCWWSPESVAASGRVASHLCSIRPTETEALRSLLHPGSRSRSHHLADIEILYPSPSAPTPTTKAPAFGAARRPSCTRCAAYRASALRQAEAATDIRPLPRSSRRLPGPSS